MFARLHKCISGQLNIKSHIHEYILNLNEFVCVSREKLGRYIIEQKFCYAGNPKISMYTSLMLTYQGELYRMQHYILH